MITVARYALWFFLIALLGVFFFALSAPGGGVFATILEITGTNAKQETLKFISLGMGGVLAAIAAIELNLRATAAMKNAEAMTKNAEAMAENNALTEKGHTQERFKVAVQNLASVQTAARIASFYQFYYLAKDNSDKDFQKSIFDILCSHLRQMTRGDEYREYAEQNKPTEECQSLLDVLFKNPQHLFAEMQANLRDVYIVGANLSDARGNVDFDGADARNVNFWGAKLPNASFRDANLQEACFTEADLSRSMFWNTDIKDVHFAGANLRGAYLLSVKNANLENFPNIETDEETQLPPGLGRAGTTRLVKAFPPSQ